MNQFPGIIFYLSGPIQYAKNNNWRRELGTFLKMRRALVLDPTVKEKATLISSLGYKRVSEDLEIEDSLEYFKRLIDEGKYEEVQKKMHIIRNIDLGMVERSDVVIVYVDLETPTFGTWEEIFYAIHHGKSVLWILDCELKDLPLWLFGTIQDLRLVFRNSYELMNFLDGPDVCKVIGKCICKKCWGE